MSRSGRDLTLDVFEGHGGEARLLVADGDRRRSHHATTVVAGVDDALPVEVDPSGKVVGEPEPVGGRKASRSWMTSGGGSS